MAITTERTGSEAVIWLFDPQMHLARSVVAVRRPRVRRLHAFIHKRDARDGRDNNRDIWHVEDSLPHFRTGTAQINATASINGTNVTGVHTPGYRRACLARTECVLKTYFTGRDVTVLIFAMMGS